MPFTSGFDAKSSVFAGRILPTMKLVKIMSVTKFSLTCDMQRWT